MTKLQDRSPLLPRRGGHLFLAALTAFMGCYNLWIAASGLRTGSIWVFTKRAEGVASRAIEPAWFWANVGGRAFFAALLFGISAACIAKAFSAKSEK
jgi:hypothetical protein